MKFVACPDGAPHDHGCVYARPDDPSDMPGHSWRHRLVTYNTNATTMFSGCAKPTDYIGHLFDPK